MKNPVEIIGDFIRFNSDSLNNMQKQAPEVAKAFSEVMKQLAIKYGNIPLPTSSTTPANPTTPTMQTIILTKEMMLDILGDIVKKDDKKYIIDKVEFTDEFGDSFSCTISLTELSKKKRKKLSFKLGEKLSFYIIPYSTETNNWELTKQFNEKSIKEGYTTLDYAGTIINIHNILSAFPFYKLKLDKEINDYYYYNKRIKNISKQIYTLDYGFAEKGNNNNSVFVALEDIVDFLLNFELKAELYSSGKSKKVTCDNQTYLIPLLVNEYLVEVDVREEFIGMKIFYDRDLTTRNSFASQGNIKYFWEVIKITNNKRKTKTFLLEHPETKEQRTIYADIQDLERIVRNLYSGILSVNGQQILIQSKFDNYTAEEFFKKIRTLTSFEWQGITNYNIYELQREAGLSDRKYLFDYQRKLQLENYGKLFFDNLYHSVYFSELLESVTFDYPRYNEQNLIQRFFYLFESTSLTYKNVSFYLRNELIRCKAITCLEENDIQDAFYNKFERKLQDIPLSLGDCFMYIKNFDYEEQKAEINIFKNFENNKLYFDYRPQGKNVPYETRWLSIDDFVKAYYVGNITTLEYNKIFYLYNTEVFQEYLVGETYPLYVDDETKELKILDRYAVKNDINYLIDGQITASSNEINKALNPEYLKLGDSVVLKEEFKRNYSQLPPDSVRLFISKINYSTTYNNVLRGPVVQISVEKSDGTTEYFSYADYLWQLTKPSISQVINSITSNPEPASSKTESIENIKFQSNSEEEAKAFQEYVIQNGAKWEYGPNEPKYLSARYFYVGSKKELSYGDTTERFNSSENREVTLEDLGIKPSKKLVQIEKDDIKFKSNSEEEARAFQEYVFSKGGAWNTIGKKIKELSQPYFFVDSLSLAFSDKKTTFDESENIEVTLEDLGIKLPVTKASNTFKQRIDTMPEELSFDYNLQYNVGNRNSPSQSAGELKERYENSDKEKELLSTYFKGNDGEWYIISEDSRGTWKWKKENLPPGQYVKSSSVNKNYSEMSQGELENRKKDILEALTAFDEEDEEYKELKLELETIELYI